MKNVLLVYLMLFSNLIIAGDRKGNGADGIVCGKKAFLLDFYEKGLFSESESSLNEVALALTNLENIKDFWQGRYELYKEQIQSFYQDSQFVAGTELGSLDDSGASEIPIPAECKLHQLVLQKLTVFGQEKRYLINQDVWNLLSNFQKAGVIFHEILYRELQSKTSKKLRKFNAYSFSLMLKNIQNEKINKIEFFNIMKSTEFKWIYWYGLPLDLALINLQNNIISPQKSYPLLSLKIFNSNVLSLEAYLDNFPSGLPKAFFYKNKVDFKDQNFSGVACKNYDQPCRVTFFENGLVQSLNKVEITRPESQSGQSDKTVFFNQKGEIDEIR